MNPAFTDPTHRYLLFQFDRQTLNHKQTKLSYLQHEWQRHLDWVKKI